MRNFVAQNPPGTSAQKRYITPDVSSFGGDTRAPLQTSKPREANIGGGLPLHSDSVGLASAQLDGRAGLVGARAGSSRLRAVSAGVRDLMFSMESAMRNML